MEGGDLGGGKRARAACGGYVCFEDEAGFTRRQPRGRTWGRRGTTPVVSISGRRSGRLSVAGLIAIRPGSRTRLCHRLLSHPAGKGGRRSVGEQDFIALIDGVHQLVRAPIVLVWDRLNTHVSRRMRDLVAEREWSTVFLLPAYSPDLNPIEWVWAHVKRSLANLAVMALDQLEALVRNRLKRLHVLPTALDMFLLDKGLYAANAREMRLARLLARFEDDYDACVIDAPPSLGIGTECALMAARRRPGRKAGLVIPVEAEDSSIRALRLLLRQLAILCDVMGEQVDILGLVPSRFDLRDGEIVSSMLQAFHGLGEPPVIAEIRKRTDIRKAWREKVPVLEYAPKSEAAQWYRDLAKVVLAA